MNEKLSDTVHVIPAAKILPPEEFLLPKEGTVVGDSAAGLYVDIRGQMFFCPYDRAGDLAVGDTTFFSSIHYERGLHVSYPQGVATIIQVAYSASTAYQFAFKRLFESARDYTTFHPRVTAVYRYLIDRSTLGLKVTFNLGSVRNIPGFIRANQIPPGRDFEAYVGKEVSAVIVAICPPERAVSSGYVEFSML
jgi:hypothetical protein